MSFLAPWFVIAGLAAVSLPVLFHLLRRTPRGRMPFSTLMFLVPSPPRLTRRSRLENWPLLLLRGLILLLLALTFGRPVWRELLEQRQDTPVGERTVVLLDTSASMRRGELWPEALRAVEQVVDRAGPDDELVLFTFAHDCRPLVSLEAWRQAPSDERRGLTRAALQGVEPTWSATNLDQALLTAVDAIEASSAAAAHKLASRAARIVLVSDLQLGSRLSQLQRTEWPKGIEVELIALTSKGTNAGVHALAAHDEAEAANAAQSRPRVLVTNAANSARESFELSWNMPNATDEQKVSVYVPPGQSRVVRAPPLPPGDVAQLVLRGDDEPFDNTYWFVPPQREQLRVLLLANEQADDPQSLRYFLERSLGQFTPGRVVSLEMVDPTAAEVRVPNERDLDDVPLVIVAQQAELSAPWNAALNGWVERGGVLLAVLLKADAAAWRGAVGEHSPHIVLSEVETAGDHALLSEIDLRHPLFAPLNDPRYSDFTKIHFWHWRRIVLDESLRDDARVIARFDRGDPALVELRRGAGRVLLLAAGWQPRESQLGVSSKFVPLMATLVELGARKSTTTTQVTAGETVDLSQLDTTRADASTEPAQEPRPNATAWTVKTPDGAKLSVSVEQPRLVCDAGPGVYEVVSSHGVQRLAVNIAAEESKTAPLGVEALESLGVRMVKDGDESPQSVSEQQTLQLRELEARQQWWRWCLVLALAVTLGETWYAGRVARREQAS